MKDIFSQLERGVIARTQKTSSSRVCPIFSENLVWGGEGGQADDFFIHGRYRFPKQDKVFQQGSSCWEW